VEEPAFRACPRASMARRVGEAEGPAVSAQNQDFQDVLTLRFWVARRRVTQTEWVSPSGVERFSVCVRTGLCVARWNKWTNFPVPQGRANLAPRFSAGLGGPKTQSPGGTTQFSRTLFSAAISRASNIRLYPLRSLGPGGLECNRGCYPTMR